MKKLISTFIALVLAAALVGQGDPFVFSLFTMSAAMFMTGLMVVMEYSVVVVNPDDFDILAHRPISSRSPRQSPDSYQSISYACLE